MASPKVPSTTDLEIALLKKIAECKRITVADLLQLCTKDVLRPVEEARLSPYQFDDIARAPQLLQTIAALIRMRDNEGWISFSYDGQPPDDIPDIDREVIWRNPHRVIVTTTRRGHIYLETGANPASRHPRAPSTTQKKVSQPRPYKSVAEIVRKKSGQYPTPKDEAAARNRIAASIAGRRGQQEFRQKLLQRFKKCVITGCDAEDVLEAAHIRPYSEAGTFDVSNGLLLRADIHTLFDLQLITIISSEMTVRIKQELKNTVYGNLDGIKLNFPKGTENIPDREALDAHQRQSGI